MPQHIINLQRTLGELNLEDAQHLSASARDTFLTLLTPEHEEWRNIIFEQIGNLCMSPPDGLPPVSANTFQPEMHDRINQGLLLSRPEWGFNRAGKRMQMSRIMPVTGWVLAQSLATDIAELGFAANKPIAAIVGRHKHGPHIDKTPIRNRLDVYTELIKVDGSGHSSIRPIDLETSTGITNSAAHIEDLELIGVIQRQQLPHAKRYRQVAGLSNEEVRATLQTVGNGTKLRTTRLRELIYEQCQLTSCSVDILATFIEARGLELELYLPTESTKSRRSRTILQNIEWLRANGLVEALEADEDPRNMLLVSANGLLLVKQYLRILEAHSRDNETEIVDKVQGSAVSKALASYLLYSDYSLGKYMNRTTSAEKDQLLSSVILERQRPVTVDEIYTALNASLSPQVIRKHLLNSSLFASLDERGRHKFYMLADKQS